MPKQVRHDTKGLFSAESTAGNTKTPLAHVNRRPLVPVCLALLAGIAASRFSAWPLWTNLVALFVGVIAAWILLAARVRGTLPVAAVLLAVAFLGMARYSAFVSYGPRHISSIPPGDAIVHVSGVVVEEPFAILRNTGRGAARVEWDALQATTGVSTGTEEAGTDEPTDHSQNDEGAVNPAAAETGAARTEVQASRAPRTGYSTTFVVEVDSLHAAGTSAWMPAEGLLLVKFFGPEVSLAYGSRVKMLGRLGVQPGPRNPGERDTTLLLKLRGVYRQLIVSKRIDIRVEPGIGGSLLVRLAGKLRHEMKAALERHVDPDQVPLAACMLLGMRESVTQEIEDNLQQTGTIHFLSVSGLHAWMIATLLWFLLRLLFVPRRFSAGILLLFVLIYCLIAGARAPVVRSCVMAGAYFLAIILRKRSDGINLLAFSALVILLARPTEMFEVGFQLSFIAVLCLLTLGRVLQDLCMGLFFLKWALPQAGTGFVETSGVFGRALRFFARWLVIGFARSAAVWVGMCAITAYYFNVFTPVAVLANILLSPVMFVLLGASLLTCVASLLWLTPLADLFGAVASWSGWVIDRLSAILASLPGLSFYLPSPSLKTVFAFFVAMAGLAAIRRVRHAALLAAASGAVFVVLAACDYCLPVKHDDAVRVTVLDVGHGLSVLVETGDGFTMLYDLGGSRSGDVGRNIVAPCLWTWKRRSVDLLALSHADDDHISGFASFARRQGVDRLWISRDFGRDLPDIALKLGVSRETLEELGGNLRMFGRPERIVTHGAAGEAERAGAGTEAATLDILWPDDRIIGDAALSDNDRSLVVKVSFGGRSVLLPGDIEQRGLKLLCSSGVDLRADVLVIPHHGGVGSLSAEFIEAVKPSVVVASRRARTGDRQSASRVLAAYAEHGARVADTSVSGAVTVRMGRNGDAEVSTFVEEEAP